MTIRNQKITIKDSLPLVKKSEDPFAPIKEAITNAFDAIKGRINTGIKFKPNISVNVYFSQRKNTANEIETWMNKIEIQDNGIGFTKEWFDRYIDLAKNTKQMNNRGTGKIQMFHRFKKISINSIFFENNTWNQIIDEWDISGEASNYTPTILSDIDDNKTIVKLENFYGSEKEQDFYFRYLSNIDDLKRDILKRFLLRLYRTNKDNELTLDINTYLNNSRKDTFIYNSFSIPQPDKEEIAIINTEKLVVKNDKISWDIVPNKEHTLTIQRFAIDSTFMDENEIYMCSKDIAVESVQYHYVNKKSDYNGLRYLTGINGDILNKYVNQSVDKFTFDSKSQIEKTLQNKIKNGAFFDLGEESIFKEEIQNKVSKKLDLIYQDVKKLEEKHQQDIMELARLHGIPETIAKKVNIELGESSDKTVEKLYVAQAKTEAKQNIATIKKYTDLKNLDPTIENYQENFKKLSDELLNEIPEQNKDELSRYVIRRNIVVDLLRMSILNELDIQKKWKADKSLKAQPEKIIQNIILRRGNTDNPNDLWVLNEEFVHFEGFADSKLEDIEINGKKLLQDNIIITEALQQVGITDKQYEKNRPDILLFPEEGKCVLIEFKAPGVDLSEHTSQIPRYAKLIANYSRKPDFEFTQFFGFLIGEKIDLVNLDTDLWKQVPFGKHRVYPSKNIMSIGKQETILANLYQEMILLSDIANRAEIRNKSFAEKLGITPLDILKAKELKKNSD